MDYQLLHLKDNGRPGPARLLELAGTATENSAHQLFGAFNSLFGIASNEIYLVSFGEGTLRPDLPEDVSIVETVNLAPTIRPVDHQRRKTPGVYVFRWFRVEPGNVEEIVRLSGEAWPTFESSFETEVQGLFVENTPAAERMLLITWYRDLSVWETSRHPPDEARDNFLRRHQLTLSATPVATLLAGDGPKLVSHS